MMAAIELAKALRKSEALADDLENQIAELQAGLDQAEGRVADIESAGKAFYANISTRKIGSPEYWALNDVIFSNLSGSDGEST